MTEIYLVRHCECEANIHNFLAGTVDYAVTEKGKGQLDGLAERFRDIRLDAVYASPLARTRATAAAIARYNGAPVSVDARFIEFNFAQYDGTCSKDLPDQLKGQWFDRPHLLSVPDGDNMQEFGPRVFAALLALAQENKGKTVAVATHGNVLRAIGLRLQHMPEDRLIDVAWSGNTGVHLVRFDDNGNWEYLLKNDTSHVPLAFAGPLERGNR